MRLYDRARTTINVTNVCWCRKQDAQMSGHGGLLVRFSGGGSTETFEYDEAKGDDDTRGNDLNRIQGYIDEMENGIRRKPARDTGPC